MGRALQALIDPNALLHNFNKIKQLAANSKVIAMIKANAYGHGILTVARILKDADLFGVACIEEGILLRRGGIKQRIVLMEGFFSPSEVYAILENDLDVVVHNKWQVDVLLEYLKLKYVKKEVNVWFKLDTGINRLGFNIESSEAKNYYNKLLSSKHVKIKGVITHFAASDEFKSDEIENDLTNIQVKKFDDFCNKNVERKIAKSLANSAAIINCPNTHRDYIRPGLMLYGISPVKGKKGSDFGLIPVMQLQTKIIEIKNIKKGEGIGYNHKYIAKKDMKIGIIAIGYADGYKSSFPRTTPVLVVSSVSNETDDLSSISNESNDLSDISDVKDVLNDSSILNALDNSGLDPSKTSNILNALNTSNTSNISNSSKKITTKTNIVGRVSMDMSAIDLSSVKNPQIGDNVILWGKDLPIEEVSSKTDVIPYELITCLGSRVIVDDLHSCL